MDCFNAWLAVSQCGATSVPIEPSQNTYNMDSSELFSAKTDRTRAIIPVHLYGQPAEMDLLNQIALEHGLFVIEDAAQAHGARYKGLRTNALGHAAATGFYPGKNLGDLGDSGGVLTNDDDITELVGRRSKYGSKSKYLHEIICGNSRFNEM